MGIRGPFLVLFPWLLFSVVSAQNHTETSSNLREGWRPEPSGRGTWSILWGCLSLLYTCIWSVLRLDIREGEEGWVRRMELSLLAVLAPECLCFIAVDEFVLAYSWQKWMMSLTGVEGAVNWTLAHCFLCGMGAVKRLGAPDGRLNEPASELRSKPYVCEPPDSSKFDMQCVRTYIQRHKRVPFDVSVAQIQAWNKSDALVIFLAMLQTTWMAVQCLVRSIKGLDISPLELVTVAYTPLTFATFLLWFRKPLITVPQIYLPYEQDDLGNEQRETVLPVPDFMGEYRLILIGAIGPGLIFCGIHLAAWDYSFPTKAESIIWKTYSCLALTACMLGGLFYVYYNYEKFVLYRIIRKTLDRIIRKALGRIIRKALDRIIRNRCCDAD